MSTPLERATRKDALRRIEKDLEETGARLRASRVGLDARQAGPPESNEEEPEGEVVDPEALMIREVNQQIRRDQRALKDLSSKREALRARIARDELEAELETAASESWKAREEQVGWLRSRTAWASSAILAAVVALAAGGTFSSPLANSAAAIHALWFAGAAVVTSVTLALVLTIFHASIEATSALADSNARVVRYAPWATKFHKVARWLPTFIVVAEMTLMGLAAWNLAILLESLVGSRP